jgi:ABC-2 type transport system ATP-binding protein
VTGLVGQNGAGKSTLLGVLATALEQSSGEIVFSGSSVKAAGRDVYRRTVGYLPQRFDLMNWSTIHRNVAYAAWCNGIEAPSCYAAAKAALKHVDMYSLIDRRAGSLSGGQRQRVGLACALAHTPQVLLLDEPTTGLDPAQRAGLRSYLADYGRSAVVVLSTHLVDDLVAVADRVVALSEGRIAFDDSLGSLTTKGKENPVLGLSDLESGLAEIITVRS